MEAEALKEVLDQHASWLLDPFRGVKANLSGADLNGANLNGADLSGVNLRYANLYDTDLYDTDLHHANLSHANLRHANLRCANLRGANLRGANLKGADLRGANLGGADLYDTVLFAVVGNGREIKSLQIHPYSIAYTSTNLQIGCKNYTFAEWEAFSDLQIAKMDKQALAFWKVYKPIIFNLIEMEKSNDKPT